MKRENLAAVFFAAVAMLAFAGSAGAVDGTIEINQAKVLAGSGFPYDISASGSYRLTGNLTVSSTTADAIDVSANNVSIDLNGFSITGPGTPSGNGIEGLVANLTVENGTVTGLGSGTGIATDVNGIVRNMRAIFNGVGIQAANGSLISGNTINSNTTGIYCTSQCGFVGNALVGDTTYITAAVKSMGNNICNGAPC